MGSSITKVAFLAVVGLLALSACTDKLRAKFDPENHDHIDTALDLSREDYRQMARPEIREKINKVELLPPPPPPLPNLKQILSAPKPPKISETQLVSIAVTDDVPLKDVLLELARLAEVDIELDAGIKGGISFIANNKPFNQVVDRIASMAALRYTMTAGVLRIERDLPYIDSYPMDFLNIERSSTSDVNISTNVLSSGGGEGGLNTGSTQTINSVTESDFWQSLESGIRQILSYTPASKVATVSLFSVQGEDVAVTGAAASDAAASAVVSSAPAGAEVLPGGGFYVLNKQAGILTISASERQHELIGRFINRIRTNASAQVLIEAKIVEVALNDRYQSGVEWSTISDKIGLVTNFNAVDFTNGGFTATLSDKLLGGLGGDVDGAAGPDLNDFLQLVEGFGTTRTLSSPRLHAINNQQAVLTFAENFVYFEINVERETDTTTGTNQELLTVDSQVKTVPIGIILTLQPSINADTGEITLMVRPTLSRVTNFVSDPAVAFLATQGGGANITNEIPVVEVRELDSILKLKSGQVMIIGGLMEDSSRNTDNGVPGVSSVPWLGNLFKSVDKTDTKRELIIFIRATLVGTDGYAHDADKTIYEKFTDDPRPLKF
ncbi:MAG: hypothetical protein P8P30_00350 [Rickettsiales bacterium]|nr:hypothetical protein [Rickettsiales bacterium]